MKLFLAGGTGFFGKWLLQTLPPDCEATVLSRDPATFLVRHPEFSRHRFVQGDIRTFPFQQEKFDIVIHAATEPTAAISDAEMHDVIVSGTHRLLQLHFGRMLYISSGAVYGGNLPEHVSEDFPCAPLAAYGKAKLEAEQLCQNSGKHVSIARCFAFVGPHLPLGKHFAIGNFIRDCLAGNKIVIQGDGTPRRSYLYMEDLTEWLWTILFRAAPGSIFNVGSDQAYSILEIAQMVRTCAGNKAEIEVLTPPGNAPVQSYVPSIARAERELRVSVRTPLPEAIAKTLAFFRSLSNSP